MLFTLRARSAVAALGLVALLAAPAAAQDMPTTGEFQSWRLPGWTFTPGVILGGLFDSNVAVAYPLSETQSTASDKLFQFQPFGQLEYFSPRTTFSSGYQGSMRHYL